jgi:hypothetical protein
LFLHTQIFWDVTHRLEEEDESREARFNRP